MPIPYDLIRKLREKFPDVKFPTDEEIAHDVRTMRVLKDKVRLDEFYGRKKGNSDNDN